MAISEDTQALVAAQLTQTYFAAAGVGVTDQQVVDQYRRFLALMPQISDARAAQKGSIEFSPSPFD